MSHIRGLLNPIEGEYPIEDVNGLQDLIDRRAYERMGKSMDASQPGHELMEQHASIFGEGGLDKLRALPESTVGGAFARFMDGYGLDPNIAEASRYPASEAAEYAKARQRETHDVVHVLLELGITPREEVVVQAFNLGQHPRWVSGMIVVGGLLRHGRSAGEAAIAPQIWRAFRNGRQARDLLSVPWERLWEMDLAALRGDLGLASLREPAPAMAA